MKVRRGLGLALLGAGLVVLSCSADRGSVSVQARAGVSTSPASAETLVESRAAATRVAELRARFRLSGRATEDDRPGLAHAARAKRAAPTTRPALGAPIATRFEPAAGADATTHVRAVLPTEALRGVTRTAHVSLPLRANDEVKLEDETSHLSVRFALEHVQDTPIELAGGMAIYRGALDGADVVHRVHAEGTEDFVVFETRPAREELSYSVDVSRVPGLRLVSNTLEFLDESGTPLLRVAPPYVVDASGQRHEAKLAVSSCAYDTSPAGPWGRKVTKPGQERCAVRLAWGGDIDYPAIVDPAWGATGSMSNPRYFHTASLLPSGRVLVAGGYGDTGATYSPLASAELFDSAGNAGAGTFAATGSMAAPRFAHTASVLPSGKVLVLGGRGATYEALTSAELFDSTGNAGAGTFAATGSMAAPRFLHTASVLPSGEVLVTGGSGAGAPLASAELFDPAGNAGGGTFRVTGSLGTARAIHTASLLPSGKVLVTGGTGDNSRSSAGALASAELFDPAGNTGAGTFTATGSMAEARENHTASVLPSGKVLVAGGDRLIGAGTSALASSELFDPAGNAGAGNFAPTGSMAGARSGHSASVLPSGRVLISGGTGNDAGLASAELYAAAGNAGAATFSATGSMAKPRIWGHTATVLPSGRVLVTGGAGLGNVPLASAELFSLIGAGAACAVGGECLSGFCADGVCCDAACNGGGCDRCDLPGKEGTCSVAPVGNPGANPACTLPDACDGVNAACPKAPTAVTCDGDHTTTGADGGTQDCAPYKCDGNGACRATCTSVNDCVAPAICDATGKCVSPRVDTVFPAASTVPPAAGAGSGGGCAVSPRSASDDRSALVCVALGLGMLGMRTRARRAKKGRDHEPVRLLSTRPSMTRESQS